MSVLLSSFFLRLKIYLSKSYLKSSWTRDTTALRSTKMTDSRRSDNRRQLCLNESETCQCEVEVTAKDTVLSVNQGHNITFLPLTFFSLASPLKISFYFLPPGLYSKTAVACSLSCNSCNMYAQEAISGPLSGYSAC